MAEQNLAQNIDFGHMPTAASYRFLTDQEHRMVADEHVYQALQDLLGELHTAIYKFDVELQRSATSLLTKQIREADAAMDHAYSALRAIVKAMTIAPALPAWTEIIDRVWQKFLDYNIDVSMEMNTELGLMDNLLTDLQSQAMRTDVQTLGLTQWITTLYNKYVTLHELLLQRTNEHAGESPRQLSEARAAAEGKYREVIQHLNAHILLEGDTQYKTCVDQLNAEVQHYNQTVINRGGRQRAFVKSTIAGNHYYHVTGDMTWADMADENPKVFAIQGDLVVSQLKAALKAGGLAVALNGVYVLPDDDVRTDKDYDLIPLPAPAPDAE